MHRRGDNAMSTQDLEGRHGVPDTNTGRRIFLEGTVLSGHPEGRGKLDAF
jgi:hypothetical protein